MYPGPFDWLSYKVELVLKKIEHSMLNNEESGLPSVHFYISEKSQNKLLEDVPKSTKKWVKGFFLLEDNTFKKIKVRHRGDNPANWMFDQKSWRIKTKKDEMFGRTRVIDYTTPQSIEYLREYSGAKIANNMGVLSPKIRLIELFINGTSKGIYLETEKLNESFLRRNKIMPVNLYKGEQYNTEAMIGIDDDLFNNPGLWTKIANFNQMLDNDKSDLGDFLSLVRKAESSDIYLNELLRRTKKWIKFSAYQVLTQNYHNDFMHNMRIVMDPWSGLIYPISHDANIGNLANNEISLLLDKSSHSLLAMLNKSSVFINDKYNTILYYLVNKRVLSQQASHLEQLENSVSISSSRDLGVLQRLYLQHSGLEKNRKVRGNKSVSFLRKLSNSLRKYEQSLISFFHSKPSAKWFYINGRFSVSINGVIPIDKISIKYSGNSPEWIGIDENSNGLIDVNEMKFRPDNNEITIPVRLYANRVSLSTSTVGMHRFSSINTVNTEFNFIAEGDFKPDTVSALNPFSKKRFILDFDSSTAVFPSESNIPIYNESYNTNEDIRVFSGIVNIDNTIIVDKKSKILPGTVFKINGNSSIIFRKNLIAIGNKENPIIFEKINSKSSQWGTVALTGPDTQWSILRNIRMTGGSGDLVDGVKYTSMFSLHNTKNILMSNMHISNNLEYDDMLHIVYCSDILFKNSVLLNAYSDAVDIDMSKGVVLDNITIINSGNDAIDLMETDALIKSSHLTSSSDKAISAGEGSNVTVSGTYIYNNEIGVASKDKSTVNIVNSEINENKLQLNAYSKNWRYAGGGAIVVKNSNFSHGNNIFRAENGSSIRIDAGNIVGKITQYGDIIVTKNY